jgi:hypothetical protein
METLEKTRKTGTMKQTSRDAYRDSRTEAAKHRDIILEVMKKYNRPMSSLMVSIQCKLSHQQVWKRMSELEKAEKIKDSKLKAVNPSGKKATMYKLVSDQLEIDL